MVRDTVLRLRETTYNQVVEEELGQVFDHVIHLSVEVVTTEHIPVLLAYFFDRLEGSLCVLGCVCLLQMRAQLWDQRRPILLHEAFGHEGDAFEHQG